MLDRPIFDKGEKLGRLPSSFWSADCVTSPRSHLDLLFTQHPRHNKKLTEVSITNREIEKKVKCIPILYISITQQKQGEKHQLCLILQNEKNNNLTFWLKDSI